MKIGITGTQLGLSDEQFDWLRLQLIQLQGWPFDVNDHAPVRELHHGDCIGADAIAHDLAIDLGLRVIIHPPTIDAKRAFCRGHELLPAKPYLERNRDIVEACDVLLALPDGPERQRSGTWSTVRYARRVGKVHHVKLP